MRWLLGQFDPRSAFLARRLSGDKWPSVEVMFAISAGVALISATLVVFKPPYLLWIAIGIETLALVILPLVMVVVASVEVSADLKREEFQLLNLTNLTGKALFQSYFVVVLYRMRVALLLTAGGLPLYVVALIPEEESWRWGAAVVIGAAIYLWGMNLIAAVMSIEMIFFRDPLALDLVLIPIALGAFGCTICLCVALGIGFLISAFEQYGGLISLTGALILALSPLWVTRGYLRAERKLP